MTPSPAAPRSEARPPVQGLAPQDPALEAEADRAATRVLAHTGGDWQALTGAGTAGGGGDQHLEAPVRSFFEARYGHDFSQVRIHAETSAARQARTAGALAYTLGADIRFSAGAYAPGSGEGRRLIAHELAHVVQQGFAPPLSGQGQVGIQLRTSRQVQRQPSPGLSLKAGDQITIEVFALQTSTELEAPYSRSYAVDARGEITIDDGINHFTVDLAGQSLDAAASILAERLVSAQLFRGPRVCISLGGATGCAVSRSAPSPAMVDAYQHFLAYIKPVKEPVDALERYLTWLETHRDSPELLATPPEKVWEQALKAPPAPKDPRAEKTQELLRLLELLKAEDDKATDPERKRQGLEARRRLMDWYDAHKDQSNFLTADLARLYADISVGVTREAIDAKVKQEAEVGRDAAERSPELMARRMARFDQFMGFARQLWGYSARTYPYSIPMPSEGKDILVTGDPAVQAVLSALARELMDWAAENLQESYFPTSDPKTVLLELLQAGYEQKLRKAEKASLQHEVIDRNELLPGKVLLSFGKTVAEGVLVIALVGAFVGAEVLTAGQATWILAGLAAGGGVKAYLDRREEIERLGYNVSVPETMIDAAGDAVGASQLIEGLSGQRLGTGMPLGSEARSEQLGGGLGATATLIAGSRAYRSGEAFGMKARPAVPGKVPAGPNAAAEVGLPRDQVPPAPAPSLNPGPVEAATRASLSPEARVGFDRWMGEIRSGGKDPEAVLKKMPADRVRLVAEQRARQQATEVALGEAAEQVRQRARDNPLQPRLRHVEPQGGRVTLHYEAHPPSQLEVAHAQSIAARTGEEIHLFGDTASGISYPGIDGTIGAPPRPLSLKSHTSQANAGSARFAAQQALLKARTHGYTQVEVQIRMPGKSVAEVKAAWDRGPTRPGDHPLEPYFDGDVVALIEIECSDGVWRVPRGPTLTGVVPPGQSDQKEKER